MHNVRRRGKTSLPPRVNGSKGQQPSDVDYEDQIQKLNDRTDKDKGEGLWSNLRGKLFTTAHFFDSEKPLSKSHMIRLLATFRMSCSFFSVINDCDEIYNYWEPLHLLLYGTGFQTWEYSPVYAIRSWLYVLLHYIPAWILSLVFPVDKKMIMFFALKVVIGAFHAGGEYLLYHSLTQRLGNEIGRIYFVLSLFSAGIFMSAASFLPSSFSMTLNMYAMAFWLREKWAPSILFTAISALVGWPFTAVLGLPIVVESLILRRGNFAWQFVKYAVASGVAVLGVLIYVDSHYYGKTVIAPLNIVLYNVISGHGPELYGVEPISYYLKNLVLNLNFLPVLAVLALPVALFVYVRTTQRYRIVGQEIKTASIRPTWDLAYWYRFLPVVLIFLAALFWAGIFFSQPHKEERFLFPIYPHIIILAAVFCVALSSLLPVWLRFLPYVIVFTSAFISVSRGFAIHFHYAGAMDAYRCAHNHLIDSSVSRNFLNGKETVYVCAGAEWHRFPSNFFIPQSTVDSEGHPHPVQYQFIKSEFKGLLPKHFALGPIPNITRQIPTEMNDENIEEPTRYVDITDCDFVIHFDNESPGTPDEPNYSKDTNRWNSVCSYPFIIPTKSHWFFRAFYVPFYDSAHVAYGRYHVLSQRT